MKEELTQLLESNDIYIFYEFLNHCAGGWFNLWEDSTGVRLVVHYASGDDGEEIISLRDGFIKIIVTKSSIKPLITDFRKFLKLKAFI